LFDLDASIQFVVAHQRVIQNCLEIDR